MSSFFYFISILKRLEVNIFDEAAILQFSLLSSWEQKDVNCLLPTRSFLYVAVLKFGYVKRSVKEGSLQISSGKKKRLRTCALGKYGDHARYTLALFIPHSFVLGIVESS